MHKRVHSRINALRSTQQTYLHIQIQVKQTGWFGDELTGVQEAAKYAWHHKLMHDGNDDQGWTAYSKQNRDVLEAGFRSGAERVIVQVMCMFFVYACMYVCMYVCVYICVYVCVYVCT